MNTFPHILGHFCSCPAVKDHKDKKTKACLKVSLIKSPSYPLDVPRECRGWLHAWLQWAGGKGCGERCALVCRAGWHSRSGAQGWWEGQPLLQAGLTSTLADVRGGEGCGTAVGEGTGNLSLLELSHYVYTSCPWQPNSVLYLGLVLYRSFFLPLLAKLW